MKKIEKVTGSFLSMGGVVMLDLDDQGTVTLQDKINEIIDYLSDKEASKGECACKSYETVDIGCEVCHPELKTDNKFCWKHGIVGIRYGKDGCNHHPPQQEESKGECRKDIWKDGVMYNDPPYVDENIRNNPQLKEESPKASDNPWLDKAHKMRLEAEEIMDKVNARINESPKEDEAEELFKIIEKHGEGTSEGYIYWESWADEPQSLKQELAGYIKTNFVSKTKLKRELRDVKDSGNFYAREAVNDLFERLGLEEL